MQDVYTQIDGIIKTKLDKRNPYNTYREIKRFIELRPLRPAEYDLYIKYARERLGI